MIKNFFSGAAYIQKGCKAFYSDKKAWKYAIIPLAIMALIYISALYGILYYAGNAADKINSFILNLPSWLSWVSNFITVMCYITGVLSALFILAATVCTFYEIFSAFFFDSMIEYHELKKYGHTIIKLSPGTQLKFIWDTVYFGIKTLFIFILLLLISIFFPITGQFLLILFMGYNLGISYMLCSANNCGMSIKELKEISNKKSGFIFGFGVTAYLLLLIPFTPLFMLPGLVLGGSELFNTQIRKGC